MENFKDVMYFFNQNLDENFNNFSTYEQKSIVDRLLRQYLRGKICYKKKACTFENNISVLDLVKDAALLYDKDAILDLVYLILNIVSNIQGENVDLKFNNDLEEGIILDKKDSYWVNLIVRNDINVVKVFEYLYDKFQNEFLLSISNKNILKNFFRYIKIPTNSDSKSENIPSSENQFVLADILEFQLKCLGVDKFIYDKEHCYVYAKIDGDPTIPSVGFIAHMDTCEDAKDAPLTPIMIDNYDCKDIVYKDNTTLKVSDNPNLLNYKGKTLITTDGITLLGADDKAGIAEIMGMIEHFVSTKEEHGDIYIAFTPDEEIGKSVDYLDRNIFNPEYAYTVDGEYLGEISYENFNAADIIITIKGNNVHAGYAKNKMVNSILIANMISNLLPKEETPNNTEGYEGYYHIHKISGTVSETQMMLLVRDFDKTNFYNRIDFLKSIVSKLNKLFNNCIEINVKNRYENMREVIEEKIEIIDIAKTAIKKAGIDPYVKPIRGGTDGTRLSFEGVPCPNLGAGGHNFHSNQEYICLEDMECIKDILVGIVKEFYLSYKEVKGKGSYILK